MPTRRLVLQTGLATIACRRAPRQGPGAQRLDHADVLLRDLPGQLRHARWSKPFQQAFPGVKVNYVPGGTSAQMVGSVRAQKADPQVDVAHHGCHHLQHRQYRGTVREADARRGSVAERTPSGGPRGRRRLRPGRAEPPRRSSFSDWRCRRPRPASPGSPSVAAGLLRW